MLDITIHKKHNKTRVLLQSTGGREESNVVLCGNRNGHHNTEHRT
jgi:hypothetical protein